MIRPPSGRFRQKGVVEIIIPTTLGLPSNRRRPESSIARLHRPGSVARTIPRQQTKPAMAANADQDKQAISESLFAFRFVGIVLEESAGPLYNRAGYHRILEQLPVVLGFNKP